MYSRDLHRNTYRTRAEGVAYLAEVVPIARRPHLLDRAEQVVRSVEHLFGGLRPDGHAGPEWTHGWRTSAPMYVPAWGCSRCDTRWVAAWSDPGRPACWCCERDDLVYSV